MSLAAAAYIIRGRMARLALLLVLASLCWLPATAFAQRPVESGCGAEVDRWVARCNDRLQRSIHAVQCPAAGLFVLDSTVVQVEVVRDPSRGFRRVHGWGLSPVGIDQAWDRTPADQRAAFEAIVACVSSDPTLPMTAFAALRAEDLPPRLVGVAPEPSRPAGRGAPGGGRRAEGVPVRVPWRALLAGALLLASWWPRRARRDERARVAALAAAAAGVVAFRWVAFPPAFFHQNGQGPLWLEMTRSTRQPYGVGFAELFGWLVSLFPRHPETALFLGQSLLAALALCAAWGLARRCATSAEGSAPTAWALAACLLVNPTLGRLAGSESYFGTCLSLQLIAAWSLTRCGSLRGSAVARLHALAPVVAGALLLSLAVAVHPSSWIPAATTPLVMLVGPGSLRRRLRRALVVYAVVGVVVAATALPGVIRVVRGELGARWMSPGASHSVDRAFVLTTLFPWLVGVVLLLVAARRPVRLLPRVAVGLLVLVVVPLTDHPFRSSTPAWITSAFTWLHAPVVLAAAAATLSDVPRRAWQAWALAAALAVGGVSFAARHHEALTEVPTDTMEIRTLMAWRARLPAGATVYFLARAQNHILSLPLYQVIDPLGRRAFTLDARSPAPPMAGDGRAYWYHASTCSTEPGRAYCDDVERGLTLERVASATFPARPSLRYLTYDRERVTVGLYRVRAVH